MTVYARNDLALVAVPTQAGGCGEVHSRPTPDGAPVKLWSLTCAPCETVLIHDRDWAGQPHQVPETPDEKDIREDVEKRGQVEQSASIAQALKDLAKLGDLPAALVGAMAQFMTTQAPKSEAPELEPAPVDEPVEPEDAKPTENDVAHMSMAELKNLAVKMGVPTARSRVEQQKLLYAALETAE